MPFKTAALLAAPAAAACACLEASALPSSVHRNATYTTYVPGGYPSAYAGAGIALSLEYGLGCSAHDKAVHPVCKGCGTECPAWCDAQWCFVGSDCDASVASFRAEMFPELAAAGIRVSYETCEASAPVSAASTSNEALVYVERAMRSVWDQVLLAWETLRSVPSAQQSQCGAAPACAAGADWAQFSLLEGDETSLGSGRLTCLRDALGAGLGKVLGTSYKGDLKSDGARAFFVSAGGDVVAWPKTTCTQKNLHQTSWFSFVTTGPRDVVMVLDMSRTMNEKDRKKIAQTAAKRVLATLTEFDFVAIVVYATDAVISSTKLARATPETLEALDKFIDSMVATGSSNMRAGLNAAIDALVDSAPSRCTSGQCHKVVLFLADGEGNSWSQSEHDALMSKNTDKMAMISAFSLGGSIGSGAAAQLQSLAFDTNGAFKRVGDGGDLAEVMGDYWITVRDDRSRQFVKDAGTVRYVNISSAELYGDSSSGTSVHACMPMYDTGIMVKPLLGVLCVERSALVPSGISGIDEAQTLATVACSKTGAATPTAADLCGAAEAPVEVAEDVADAESALGARATAGFALLVALVGRSA